ncbi:hypothetical protein CK203_041997 [Vitis vinifera]|uniref:Uncharacterized protein n=1 Tax=Vitis vinifera TaxID=29760 RepID=A0A438I0D4_VITVI|nr:hypothetical protein CK203_041997 [Vitis vinifera]
MNGLRLAIQDQVSLQRPYKVSDAYQLALKVEAQFIWGSSKKSGPERSRATIRKTNNINQGGQRIAPREQVEKQFKHTTMLKEKKIDEQHTNDEEEGIKGDMVGDVLVIWRSMLAPQESRCTVVPMDACHILLGCPWQFDRKTVHHDDKNTYSFYLGKKKFVLKPMRDQVAAKKENKFRFEFK